MRNILIIIALIGVLNAGDREALLIGNYSYKYIDILENPKQSIKNLKKALIKLGFNVKDVYDLDSENLSAEVMSFRDRLKRDSIGFFYYSGHGCQLANQSYLIPTNVDTKEPSRIKYHSLSINELLDNLEQSKNRVNMLFLDACRDVPIGSRGGTKGLGQINNTPKGSLIVYATESGKTAQDNSLFIKELTNSIQQPNKKIWEIGNYLSNTIARKTGDKQIPEMFSKRLPSGLMLLSSDKDKFEPIVKRDIKYSLTINPTPSDAKVYIMNIIDRYKDGIKLKKGDYKIKVKLDGYFTKIFDIELESDKGYSVKLDEAKAVVSKSKWITPTNSICKANGGKLYKGVCDAKWKDAKKICSASGGRLPTFKELRKVITDCGGEIDASKKNKANKSYQQCYKAKGFISSIYWSSTTHAFNSSNAWVVNINYGYDNYYDEGFYYLVRCVRDGQ